MSSNNDHHIDTYLLTIFSLNILFFFWWSIELQCRGTQCIKHPLKIPKPFFAVFMSCFSTMASSFLLFYISIYGKESACFLMIFGVIFFNLFGKLCIWVFFLLRAKMVATTLSGTISRFLRKAKYLLVKFAPSL